ncbi:glycosyltransferase [Shewanella psychrophila]|uniref:Glycosyltransferase n=1 Tax=Shewanella psychrophila TaxID=225848 RepID=A0A1S6HK94_9GAMM|nr:glycosyltransferase family 4 protein [Shewanella psychrophila]AQS35924.1 glycosyltransferase [Shewanella psychrophila]
MEKICFALHRFRADKKEAMSKNFVNLVEGISQKGEKVVTYTPIDFITVAKVEKFFYRSTSRYSSLAESVNNLWLICRDINRNHLDYKFINFHIATPVESFLLTVFLCRSAIKKTVVSIWQSYLTFDELKGNFKYFFSNSIKYLHILIGNSFACSFLYTLSLKQFHKVIVHCEYQRKQLVVHGVNDITLIRNGVFSLNDFPIDVLPDTKVQSDDFVLLYLGHAKASKGVNTLIELAASLEASKALEFTLILALSGFGEKKHLCRLVKHANLEHRVCFKDEVSVLEEMTNADLLLLPLRTCVGTSLMPNVIIEAMSLGLPVAVPSYPELQELVSLGENAFELDISDIDSTSRMISTLSKNRSLLEKVARSQKMRIRDGMTLDNFVDGYFQSLT